MLFEQLEPLSQEALKYLWSVLPQARLVGGVVRDLLAQRPITDIDMATPQPPEEVIRLLQAAGIHVVPTGLQHGTVTAVIEGVPYEITTLRRDEETDGRHARADEAALNEPADRPVLARLQVMEADAARRDEPQAALPVLGEGHGQSVQDLAGGILECLEMQAVVHTDSLARAKPDESVAVLEDGPDGVVRQAVVGTEIPEGDGAVLGGRGQERCQEGGYDEQFFHFSFFGHAR